MKFMADEPKSKSGEEWYARDEYMYGEKDKGSPTVQCQHGNGLGSRSKTVNVILPTPRRPCRTPEIEKVRNEDNK